MKNFILIVGLLFVTSNGWAESYEKNLSWQTITRTQTITRAQEGIEPIVGLQCTVKRKGIARNIFNGTKRPKNIPVLEAVIFGKKDSSGENEFVSLRTTSRFRNVNTSLFRNVNVVSEIHPIRFQGGTVLEFHDTISWVSIYNSTEHRHKSWDEEDLAEKTTEDAEDFHWIINRNTLLISRWRATCYTDCNTAHPYYGSLSQPALTLYKTCKLGDADAINKEMDEHDKLIELANEEARAKKLKEIKF